MNFTRHLDKAGKHALLSASTWRWINDTPDEMLQRITSQYASQCGTILHSFAEKHIRHLIKLNKYDKKNVILELASNGIPRMVIDQIDMDVVFENLFNYVNDAIGFRMTPEVVLMYSDNMWGSADAIAFDERERFLRIHDYKSGFGPVFMEQVMIYEALFCLEYDYKPEEINSELRIYKSGQIIFHTPSPEEINFYIEQTINADRIIQKIKKEV